MASKKIIKYRNNIDILIFFLLSTAPLFLFQIGGHVVTQYDNNRSTKDQIRSVCLSGLGHVPQIVILEMSAASRVTLGLAVTVSTAIIGYVHYKQSADR